MAPGALTSMLHACCSADLLISPQVAEFWSEKACGYGPGLSGALFGGAWWFWLDAVAASHVKVTFIQVETLSCSDYLDVEFAFADVDLKAGWVQYLPGIIATLALLMINAIRREELNEIDPFDDGAFCRSRFWLFLSYCISIASAVMAVWVLLHFYAWNETGVPIWPGVAAIFQVALILGSALLFFISRTECDSSYGGYGSF